MLIMAKNYVSVTLDQYVNESNSITLKRGYKDRTPVVVGASAPIRNQVLSYVAEGKKISSSDLKRFVAGLNETNSNPNAAATMWLRRNSKFFVSENVQGRTFYKLSIIGKRLVNSFGSSEMNENRNKFNFNKRNNRINEMFDVITPDDFVSFVHNIISSGMSKSEAAQELRLYLETNPYMHSELGEVPGHDKYIDGMDLFNSWYTEDEFYNERDMYETKKYDFKDPKTKKPGIIDKDKSDDEVDSIKEGLSEIRKKRIEKIIEDIKYKSSKFLNEDEDETDDEEKKTKDKKGSADELSFDDLDLEREKKDDDIDDTEEVDDTEKVDDDESSDEKVEITEFIITVDNVDSALEELAKLDVDASKVVDPDAEPEEGDENAYKENEISVKAEDWEELKSWLEEKGVDVEEMFGGEIEVEEDKEEEEEEEDNTEEIDLDLDMDEDLDETLGLDEDEDDEIDTDNDDEFDTDNDDETDEYITDMEDHEDNTNNLIKGAKQVIINYK